jgi:hypothetical protein
MKQGTRSNGGEKLKLVLVDLSKYKCDSRVIVPDPSHFLRMGRKNRLRIALPVKQQHVICVIQSSSLFAIVLALRLCENRFLHQDESGCSDQPADPWQGGSPIGMWS